MLRNVFEQLLNFLLNFPKLDSSNISSLRTIQRRRQTQKTQLQLNSQHAIFPYKISIQNHILAFQLKKKSSKSVGPFLIDAVTVTHTKHLNLFIFTICIKQSIF